MDSSLPNAAESFQAALHAFNARDWTSAEAFCRQAIAADPQHAEALHMLALALNYLGRIPEAITRLRAAIAIQPDNHASWTNLGEIYREQQMFDDAIACQRESVRLNPDSPDAQYNFGLALRDAGQTGEAIAALQRATQLRPDYAEAHYNLANLLLEQGRLNEAIAYFEVALSVHPEWPDAHFFLGIACFYSGMAARAVTHFREVIRLEPTRTGLHQSIGYALAVLGRTEEAKAAYVLAGHEGISVLGRESLGEPIAADQQAIENYKSRLSAVIREFTDRGGKLKLAALQAEVAVPGMILPYYGGDSRQLMEQFAQAVSPQIPRMPLPPRRGKPKLGIVVTLSHEAAFARCWGGIAQRLSRELFDVRVVCTQGSANALRESLQIPEHEFLHIPTSVVEAARVIAEQEFDWLHYWEIGTSASNYYLPFFQAAPGQSGCWGWPVTSGIPEVDVYLSCEQLERPGADAHYSEQLVRMQHLPTYFRRPSMPDGSLTRSNFGLRDDQHVYLCTQNLRKYHPDFDPLLADLLRNDPQGVVLIISDGQAPVTERLAERFCRTVPDVLSRLMLLPRMQRNQYLSLVALADVALDTVHYGGGANTVYDAAAVGTPLVTLPDEFHRTQWAAAVNRRLGLPQLIASTPQEYVAQAIAIGSNRDQRRMLGEQIRQAASQLFEDDNAVAEHDAYFSQAIAALRAKQ